MRFVIAIMPKYKYPQLSGYARDLYPVFLWYSFLPALKPPAALPWPVNDWSKKTAHRSQRNRVTELSAVDTFGMLPFQVLMASYVIPREPFVGVKLTCRRFTKLDDGRGLGWRIVRQHAAIEHPAETLPSISTSLKQLKTKTAALYPIQCQRKSVDVVDHTSSMLAANNMKITIRSFTKLDDGRGLGWRVVRQHTAKEEQEEEPQQPSSSTSPEKVSER